MYLFSTTLRFFFVDNETNPTESNSHRECRPSKVRSCGAASTEIQSRRDGVKFMSGLCVWENWKVTQWWAQFQCREMRNPHGINLISHANTTRRRTMAANRVRARNSFYVVSLEWKARRMRIIAGRTPFDRLLLWIWISVRIVCGTGLVQALYIFDLTRWMSRRTKKIRLAGALFSGLITIHHAPLLCVMQTQQHTTLEIHRTASPANFFESTIIFLFFFFFFIIWCSSGRRAKDPSLTFEIWKNHFVCAHSYIVRAFTLIRFSRGFADMYSSTRSRFLHWSRRALLPWSQARRTTRSQRRIAHGHTLSGINHVWFVDEIMPSKRQFTLIYNSFDFFSFCRR